MEREYELMYIVRADLDDDALRGATENVASLIAAQGGTVLKSTSWGRRRLAYEIQHMRDGQYMLVEMRLDGGRVTELERQLRISDAVIRHMITILVHVDEEPQPRDMRVAAPAMVDVAQPTGEEDDGAEGDDSAESEELEEPAADADGDGDNEEES